jgi:hypothetical protein
LTTPKNTYHYSSGEYRSAYKGSASRNHVQLFSFEAGMVLFRRWFRRPHEGPYRILEFYPAKRKPLGLQSVLSLGHAVISRNCVGASSSGVLISSIRSGRKPD